MKVSYERIIESLQVMDDKKLVLLWANGKSHIENMVLMPIMEKKI